MIEASSGAKISARHVVNVPILVDDVELALFTAERCTIVESAGVHIS